LTELQTQLTTVNGKLDTTTSDRVKKTQGDLKTELTAQIEKLTKQNNKLNNAVSEFDQRQSTAGDAAFNEAFGELVGKQAQQATLEAEI
jgi:uncharacterized protein YPO0396